MCIYCENSTDSEIREYGRVFGYPECCIEQFIKDKHTVDLGDPDPRTEEQKSVALLTQGFVPCKEHMEKLSSGEIDIFDIVEGRDFKKARELNELTR